MTLVLLFLRTCTHYVVVGPPLPIIAFGRHCAFGCSLLSSFVFVLNLILAIRDRTGFHDSLDCVRARSFLFLCFTLLSSSSLRMLALCRCCFPPTSPLHPPNAVFRQIIRPRRLGSEYSHICHSCCTNPPLVRLPVSA